jgi:hypothetical protein
MAMPYGPLDEARKLGPSEYDDDDLGWAGKGDLGVAKGRQPTGGELAAKLRQDADAAMARAYPPPDAPA